MRIDQLLPATGWVAAYLLPNEPFAEALPVHFWAIARESDGSEGGDRVVGMISERTIQSAEERPGGQFYGYYDVAQVTQAQFAEFLVELQKISLSEITRAYGATRVLPQLPGPPELPEPAAEEAPAPKRKRSRRRRKPATVSPQVQVAVVHD